MPTTGTAVDDRPARAPRRRRVRRGRRGGDGRAARRGRRGGGARGRRHRCRGSSSCPTAAARQRPELAASHGERAFAAAASRARRQRSRSASPGSSPAATPPTRAIVEPLAAAHLVHLPGGDPDLIPAMLRDSPAWAAIRRAYDGGAVVAGASAGAMALAERCWTPAGPVDGLGLVPGLRGPPALTGPAASIAGAARPRRTSPGSGSRSRRSSSGGRRPVDRRRPRPRARVRAGRHGARERRPRRDPAARLTGRVIGRAARSAIVGTWLPLAPPTARRGSSNATSRTSTTARSARARTRCSRPSGRGASGWRRSPSGSSAASSSGTSTRRASEVAAFLKADPGRASRSCPTRRPASRPSSPRSGSSPATSSSPATTSTTRRSTRCGRPRPATARRSSSSGSRSRSATPRRRSRRTSRP